MRQQQVAVVAAAGGLAAVAGWTMWSRRPVEPGVRPPGRNKDSVTHVLELGSSVMQSAAPLRGMHTYMVRRKRKKAEEREFSKDSVFFFSSLLRSAFIR